MQRTNRNGTLSKGFAAQECSLAFFPFSNQSIVGVRHVWMTLLLPYVCSATGSLLPEDA